LSFKDITDVLNVLNRKHLINFKQQPMRTTYSEHCKRIYYIRENINGAQLVELKECE